MAWNGSISLNDGSVLQDVQFTQPATSIHALPGLPQDAKLKLLSFVETARIPIYISIGAPLKVTTGSYETEGWLRQTFASSSASDDEAWWRSARPDSELGVLLGVEGGSGEGPRVTEVLLYASRSDGGKERLPTPPPSSPGAEVDDTAAKAEATLSIHALLLSSDLLHIEATPPPSPTTETEDVEAVFLPHDFPSKSPEEAEVINNPPVRKRRSAADVFDEADSRRKKARRRGGEGVIAAAAPKAESQLPSLKHRRSVSASQPVPLQTRLLSRSPSVASSRPPTAAGTAAGRKSALSQVQSQMQTSQERSGSMETKNKDFVSRIVMAGMRLHGLSQSKPRSRLHPTSGAPSPAIDVTFSDLEAERKNDEEFKLIYHQVYKGTCFAFRSHIGTQSLQPFAEQVRETVDKLLGIFCSDPLAEGLPGGGEEVTPGGRKAFGSASGIKKGMGSSPFVDAKVVG